MPRTRSFSDLSAPRFALGASAVAVIASVTVAPARAQSTVTLAPPVRATAGGVVATQRLSAASRSVFQWQDVPVNRKVPITRAVFDQGGYQLLDDVGETIVVPFAGQNLFVLRFGRSEDGMYFVNDGMTPTLYLPPNGYLENVIAQGARWYPFPRQSSSSTPNVSTPVYISIAQDWSDFLSSAIPSNVVVHGGYPRHHSHHSGGRPWSGGDVPMPGFSVTVGGHTFHSWHDYHAFYQANLTPLALVKNPPPSGIYHVPQRGPGHFGRGEGGAAHPVSPVPFTASTLSTKPILPTGTMPRLSAAMQTSSTATGLKAPQASVESARLAPTSSPRTTTEATSGAATTATKTDDKSHNDTPFTVFAGNISPFSAANSNISNFHVVLVQGLPNVGLGYLPYGFRPWAMRGIGQPISGVFTSAPTATTEGGFRAPRLASAGSVALFPAPVVRSMALTHDDFTFVRASDVTPVPLTAAQVRLHAATFLTDRNTLSSADLERVGPTPSNTQKDFLIPDMRADHCGGSAKHSAKASKSSSHLPNGISRKDSGHNQSLGKFLGSLLRSVHNSESSNESHDSGRKSSGGERSDSSERRSSDSSSGGSSHGGRR